MEGLNIEAQMLTDEEQESLFGDDFESEAAEEDSTKEGTEKDNKEEEDINPDALFSSGDEDSEEEEESEDISDEEHKEKGEDAASTEDDSSPNFFSSIANAFVEEGIFPDLDDDVVKGIKTAKDFRDAIEEQIKAGLTEQQKRVAEALDNNVAPSKIKQYENVITYLNSINDEALDTEDEKGEDLRKRILFQDYINRGFSEERAKRAVTRAIENGTDIEDAKEALESVRAFYKDEYNQVLEDARKEREEEETANEKRAEKVKKLILDNNAELFKGVDVDKKTRQVAFDAVSKPIYKDPKTGDTYTAIQKYELENKEEFVAKLGLLYAVTDGFKNIDKIVNTKVKKEIKKGLSKLEEQLSNTRRAPGGSLRFSSGADDKESYLGKGVTLDI